MTPEEHQKLKAIAALQGQRIKAQVLNRTLGEGPALAGTNEHEAFCASADFLKPRIEQARRWELSSMSAADIRREAREQVRP
ncbi:MAG: antitoxin [Boseongicola sp. SB0664_bin_43]|uniref:Antitoxin n=1 Tax=Boseongicola sp. SB0664_bin_43 TaxID=2604844 RepID=A0A6B0Y468_9RHOB|nr:antitoxin [Boseongicola sp. SB0664_bin_43]